jgi:hypothetical protein
MLYSGSLLLLCLASLPCKAQSENSFKDVGSKTAEPDWFAVSWEKRLSLSVGLIGGVHFSSNSTDIVDINLLAPDSSSRATFMAMVPQLQ